MTTTNVYDPEGERINCAADWLIDAMEDWSIGMLPSYQKMCKHIADNAYSIRKLNVPGCGAPADDGILTLVDRIGGILYDDYFQVVTGRHRCAEVRHRVGVIRGAVMDRGKPRGQQRAETPTRLERRAV